MEPLRRDGDAARTRVHAGNAPTRQGHRAAGTTGRTPRASPGVRGMSGPHGRTGEMERCAEAPAPHRRLSPRVDARSKPVSVPLPHPRFAVQPRTRACHDRRSAFGSRRFRVASGPHRACAMGTLRSRADRGARGRTVPTPVSVDRTRGNDAGTGRRPSREEQLKE